ncbi:MAG: hypothetical protein PCFJNLEI_00264 [Verrucomicrobiae bacterium]|nr:hypothetical protein [Verrucomicrobiae bacterium]
MFSIKHLGRFSALVSVAAFLASTAINLNAATPPAQVGIITIGGSPVSGGEIYYQFVLEATDPGTLVVKAKIKGKKLKATLPDLTQNVAAGLSPVTGPVYQLPSDFVGTAKLQTKISLNGKKLSTKTVEFAVTAPPPPPAAPTAVTLRDVGFENLVTLDGSAVPAGSLGVSPTYEWTQLAGMPAVLSSTTAVAPTFTTGHLTNFVDMAEKFGGIDGVGFDAEQVKESTYQFQLVVSGNGQSRTGVFTVVCTSIAPKQPNTPIGALAYFKAETNSTDWVLVSKPIGSTSTLINPNSLTPALRPDLEGTYIIQDNVSGAIRTNTGASWTGVEFCAICHGPGNTVGLPDLVTPWEKTGHATFFKEMITSGPAYYNESCIGCHTVGYDKTPTAVNNGFDDVAKDLGWKFPSSINSNNWNNMPVQLQRLSNIQCESCHGPGSRHPGATSVSLNVAVCAQCHQDGHYHTRVEQWERSPHFKGFKELSEEEGERSTCSRCHAPDGYVDVAKRIASGQDVVTASKTNNYATGIGELICQGCHDPHHTFDDPERHQLRIFDEVVIGAPAAAGSIVLSNQGASATCMYCHNSRNLPEQLSGGNPYYRSTRSGQISGPHLSPVSEVLNGLGALTYGVPMGNTFHTYGANCISCHMYPNPAIGAAGHNQVGDHTFKMYYMDGDTKVENLAACNQCHAGSFAVDKFDFKSLAAKDWDGNGNVDGIQTETLGLLGSLETMLNTTGLQSITNELGDTTGFRTNGLSAVFEVREAQLKATWNWMLITRDNSKGVHNPLFTLRLLQNTYTDLSTNYYGDVSQTFQNAFPSAVLR